MTKQDLREENVPCGCGRSPTGFCTGLHSMTEQEYQDYLEDQLGDDWPDNPAE